MAPEIHSPLDMKKERKIIITVLHNYSAELYVTAEVVNHVTNECCCSYLHEFDIENK